MPRPTASALCRILVARGFACPTSWWDSCLHFDNCQPKVITDVISGVVVDSAVVDALVKFGDSS